MSEAKQTPPTEAELALGDFREAIRRIYDRVLRDRRPASAPPLLRVSEALDRRASLPQAIVAAALSRYGRL